MDRENIIDLLAIISANDNRTIGLPDIQIWEQALRFIENDDALEAVLTHIREKPGVWLEPGHVVAGVRAIRNDRYERADVDYRHEVLNAAPGAKRDRYGHIDKSAPDEPEYPPEWTTEQRISAYWKRINALRDQHEIGAALNYEPGSRLLNPPASQETRQAAMTKFANRFAADQAGGPSPHVNVLLVACPWCHAAAGEHCTRPGSGGQREKLRLVSGHPARIEAAEQAEQNGAESDSKPPKYPSGVSGPEMPISGGSV